MPGEEELTLAATTRDLLPGVDDTASGDLNATAPGGRGEVWRHSAAQRLRGLVWRGAPWPPAGFPSQELTLPSPSLSPVPRLYPRTHSFVHSATYPSVLCLLSCFLTCPPTLPSLVI